MFSFYASAAAQVAGTTHPWYCTLTVLKFNSVIFRLKTPASITKSYSLAYQPNPPKNKNVNVLSLCTSRALHVNLMHSETGDDIHKHNRTCSNTKICLYRINIVALEGLHLHQEDQVVLTSLPSKASVKWL